MGVEVKVLYLTMNAASSISNAVMLMEENKSVRQRDENRTTEATKQLWALRRFHCGRFNFRECSFVNKQLILK